MSLYRDFQVPNTATTLAPSPGTELRGFTLRYDGHGRPRRLSGTAKLEDDLRLIVQEILQQRLLTNPLIPGTEGALAGVIRSELENPERWWPGQEVPVQLSEVSITAYSATRTEGVRVTYRGETMAVEVRYLERTLGIRQQTALQPGEALALQTLTIPFGALREGA